jgi:hypothetical protein
MEKSEILNFVKNMKPKDHVILFYSKPEDKRGSFYIFKGWFR